MSKSRISMFLVFCLSFAVVFGGWFFTKEMLDRKEAEILAGRGRMMLDIPESDNRKDRNAVQETFEGEALSEDVMAEILKVWEAGGRELLHEPLAGQMDMEQAVKAGRGWIGSLAENNILPSCLAEGLFDSTSAVLCTLDGETTLGESLISYWRVIYMKGGVKIILTIHAVSGQVWDADISMREDEMMPADCTEEELLAAAFPFLTGNEVYAAYKREDIVVNKQEPIVRLLFSLHTEEA